jgi:hypothetical protein
MLERPTWNGRPVVAAVRESVANSTLYSRGIGSEPRSRNHAAATCGRRAETIEVVPAERTKGLVYAACTNASSPTVRMRFIQRG